MEKHNINYRKNPIDPATISKVVKPLLRVHHVIKINRGIHSIVGTYLSFINAKRQVDSYNEINFGNPYVSSELSYYVKTCSVGLSHDMEKFTYIPQL